MDILDFLKTQGVEIEKADEFKSEFYKNFKTVEEVNSKVGKLDKVTGELEELSKQLTDKSKEADELTQKLSEVEETNKAKITELEGSLGEYKLKDTLLDKGVKREHSDYVLYKLGQMEGEDLDKNLNEVIKANPFLTEKTVKANTIPKGESTKSKGSFNEKVREVLGS